MPTIRYWAIAFVPAAASLGQPEPVLLGYLDYFQLGSPTAQIHVNLAYTDPHVPWNIGSWLNGWQGTVEVAVPQDFAQRMTNCVNESLYVMGGSLGKTEGPHPRLGTWNLGGPDLGGADILFLRLTIYQYFNVHMEFWGNRGCEADCDQNCTLDIFDFLCFQNSFVNSEPYACDCDTSTGIGVCDIFDFLCFQDAFVGGCP